MIRTYHPGLRHFLVQEDGRSMDAIKRKNTKRVTPTVDICKYIYIYLYVCLSDLPIPIYIILDALDPLIHPPANRTETAGGTQWGAATQLEMNTRWLSSCLQPLTIIRPSLGSVLIV